MSAAEKRLDSIAHNIANSDTPAYKRMDSVTQSFRLKRGAEWDDQPRSWQRTDFSQGTLRPTGSPWHVGLEGDGFFVVDSPQGQLYTRNGSLRIDDQGVLQTVEGYPVAWSNQRGQLDPRGANPVIEKDGTVFQGDQEIGQMRIVSFDRLDQLRQNDIGYWKASPSLAEQESKAIVHQGTLEGSNTSAVDELVGLIRVQRSFESTARLLQMVDQSYQRLTRRT